VYIGARGFGELDSASLPVLWGFSTRVFRVFGGLLATEGSGIRDGSKVPTVVLGWRMG
jgi:hypothetical protein